MKAIFSLFLFAFAIIPTLAMAGGDGKTDNIKITGIFSYPSSGTTGAVFMTITNKGKEDVSIVSAASPASDRVEIHGHKMNDAGVMHMYKLDKLDIAAGKSVKLEPGSFHIMLFDLKNPLKDGDKLPLSLKLSSGEEISVTSSVKADE